MDEINKENQVQAEEELVVDVVDTPIDEAEAEAVETNSGGDEELDKYTRGVSKRINKLNDKVYLNFKTKEVLIIENMDEKVSEKILFSLWNSALQDNKYFLITSEKPINTYKIKLNDLKSRINSCLNIGIDLPSDDLISVILAKNFSDKQISVEKKHIDYIIKRIDRSYEKISQFILTLDKYSLKKGSPFDLKMIKEVLKMI